MREGDDEGSLGRGVGAVLAESNGEDGIGSNVAGGGFKKWVETTLSVSVVGLGHIPVLMDYVVPLSKEWERDCSWKGLR